MNVSSLIRATRTNLSMALSGVLQHPLRSLLTLLTASVGIASVVASMAILKGGRKQIRGDLSKLGLDIVVVQNMVPSFGEMLKSKLLNLSHVEQIRSALGDEIEAVAPAVFRRYSVSRASSSDWKTTTVIGTTAEFSRMLNLDTKAGRFLTEAEVKRNELVCVIDSSRVSNLFDDGEKVIGKEVDVVRGTSKCRLKVRGVLADPYSLRKPRGTVDTAMMSRSIFASRLEFKNIYVPMGLVSQDDQEISTILLRVKDSDRVEAVVDKVQALFEPSEDYVWVWSQKEWIQGTLRTVHDFTGYSNIIWVVMVVVASVMIMTIRFVSVRERYREIGVRRTEGATKATIALQFALEGIMLCASGGLMGIGLGMGLAKLVEATTLRWPVIFSGASIVVAAVLSIAVGILSSILPAGRAASLKPVEALRLP